MTLHLKLARMALVAALALTGLQARAYAAPTVTPTTQTVNGTAGKSLQTARLTASGFSGTVSYSIDATTPLPTGWAFSASSGQITASAPVVQPGTLYRINAKGATSGTAQATATITVNPPPSLLPATQTISALRNQALAPTATFTASNFAGTVSYAVSPALPAGLTFSKTTGSISGTPTLPQAAATYTVTATDGKSTAKATISLAIADNCITATLDPVGEGRRAYLRMNCYSCHGMDGKGGMGPKITGQNDVGERVSIGSDHGMPAYSNYLCPNDISNLNAYLLYIDTQKSFKSTFMQWWVPNPQQ